MTRHTDRRATVTQIENADSVGQLIARAGRRRQPPPEFEARVRAAVHSAWRDEVARRSWRRRATLAMAATIAAVAAGIGWHLTGPATGPTIVVAAVESASGPVTLKSSDGVLRDVGDGAAVPVHAGEGLTTGLDGGARVRVAGLTEIRIAPQSRITVVSADRVRLETGALFVDSGDGAASLVIDTPLGSVAHVGTRYQVRVTSDATTVMVREGKVRLALGKSAEEAVGEEQLVVKPGGWVTRSRLPTYGDAWRWADSLAQAPRIDGLALVDFLDWVADETGRTLDFASEDAAASARSTTLHGSIEGLSPEEALHSVLATTDLSAQLADGQLVVQQFEDR